MGFPTDSCETEKLRPNFVIPGMLKAEELTREQLVTEYYRLRTESEAEVTNLRGKVDSLRGKNDSLHAKLEAQTKNSLVSNLDDIIERKDQLHSLTGCTPEEFKWILTRFTEYVESLEGDDARRFLELTNDRGHVNKFPVRHVLLVTLIRLRCNTKQELLAAILKINQSNICRYIQFTKQGLIKILPTADTVAKAISQIKSASDFKEIVPGRAGGEIKTDGTHVRVQRPEKNQEAMYSGKQKTHTYNVQITSNKKRLIIHVSGVYEGKRHDYGIFKNDIPLGGKWGKSLKESTTLPSEKITVIADAGYQGMKDFLPGAKVMIPYRGRESLTKTERKYNQYVSKRRILIENVIRMLKVYRRLSQVYDGSREEFREDLLVVSGLHNLHIMHKHTRYKKFLKNICP